MHLDRYHGLGNDYLVLEPGYALDPALVRAICDRHTGAGSDGILEPRRLPEGDAAPDAEAGVRIWNPDGSIAEKSGNGLRIFARWRVDALGVPPRFRVWTGFDVVDCEVGEEAVRVAMGPARLHPKSVPVVGDGPVVEEPLDIAGQTLGVTAVGMGNPHAVVFVDGPGLGEVALDALNWTTWGAVLEVHPRFPNRTNVQFARVLDGPGQRVAARIWERGAGATSASGSSSCAVAAAAVRTGRLRPGAVSVVMPGGELAVTVPPFAADATDGPVLLEGPVERVGRIELDPTWLAARSG